MATIDYPNAPKNLTIQDFRALNDMYGSLQKSCRFIVQILPTGQYLANSGQFTRDLMYLCEVAEFPGRNFESVDVRYYGPNHKLPHKSVYEDINLTFVCRNKSFERQFFDNWQLVINPVNSWDFNYRDQYTADINVYQYDDYGGLVFQQTGLGDPNTLGGIPRPVQANAPQAQYLMTLRDAYPININSQPVTWADDQFQRLIVTFTYHYWIRPGIDPLPRTGATQGFSFDLVKGSSFSR